MLSQFHRTPKLPTCQNSVEVGQGAQDSDLMGGEIWVLFFFKKKKKNLFNRVMSVYKKIKQENPHWKRLIILDPQDK